MFNVKVYYYLGLWVTKYHFKDYGTVYFIFHKFLVWDWNEFSIDLYPSIPEIPDNIILGED